MKPPLHDASAAAGLFARYVEGALSPEELAALETSLHQDEKLRGALADWLHLEGILRAEADTLFQEAAAGDTGSRRVIRFPSPWRWAAVAALLCLGVGAGLGRWLRPAPVEIVEKAAPASAPAIGEENVSAVATLADTRACKWGSGSLPTAEGSRLTAGHLELVEGWRPCVSTPGPRSLWRRQLPWRLSMPWNADSRGARRSPGCPKAPRVSESSLPMPN